MLEFDEFLKIIKGGQGGGKPSKEEGKEDASGAIYSFFKGLTTGKLNEGGNKNVPFSLYIS